MNTILLVDDNPQILEGLSEMLRAFGLHVFTADDGLAALRTLERVRPDLVVCDVEMPRLDGFGLLERVRAHPTLYSLPFVFLTGLDNHDSRQVADDLGADGYLVKPLGMLELLVAIRRQLDGLPPQFAEPTAPPQLAACGAR